ncbi:MAG TPA: hypothetical protein VN282_00535 [Pyrinomonadaceae bacterium]|nr:hypothetical protein [Pyrinomonadaceae bacterium]
MPTYTNPLEHVRVAAPCPADWSKMVGDERVRYCNRCSLHVYNLSGMTQREAEALVTSSEGRLCVRYYRRADGTVLTRNCPVGLSALKRRAAHAATATLTAVLGFFAGLGLNFGVERAVAPEMMEESAVPAPYIPEPDMPVGHAAQTYEQGEAKLDEIPFMGVMVREVRSVERLKEGAREFVQRER